MAVPIPFPLSSSPGRSPQESAGRLINCYAEPLGKAIEGSKKTAPPQAVWRRVPGLTLFGATANSGFRGQINLGATQYVAWSGKVSKYNSSGVESTLTGTLTGSEKVFWARNNAGTPDVVCVAPGTGAFTVTSTAVTTFADSDVGSPNCTCFMDGFFIFSYGDGTLQASGLNAVTISTLDKTTAQSKPGGLTRVVPFNGQLVALGPNFGEVYSDTANATGFPFSRSYVLQRGLLSPYALAGHEDGFASALIWVADDCSVVLHNASPNPQKISPPDLDRLIAGVADKSTLEAMVYIAGDHAKWVLSCPSFTWEFDLNTQKWNERSSYLSSRWRAIGGNSAFGKWLVGDVKNAGLLYLDETNYTENGDPLVFQIESAPVQGFPNRTKVARADFNFVTGVGIATGSDPIATQPTVGVSWTQNLGVTWGLELVRQLGRQTTPEARVTLTRTGMTGTQGRRWRLKISDPVYAAFLGGTQDMAMRNH